MFALLIKEINSFLNSLIGYIVIAVFLLTIGLFMWIFPGELNVIDSGYANIDSLFSITPWVYMLLVPAVTMRLFSEEKKTGTIELLLTRPLTEMQVVMAKYLSGVILVFISLLPTIIYCFTIYSVSFPVGNIDTGSIIGSYIGLLLLGAGFVAIGLFASAISDNQVVSFIIAFFLCLLCYTGFELASTLSSIPYLSNLLFNLGVHAHYVSMSRGVVDTRDLIYFFSLIFIFLFSTRTVIESRKW
jgi:ABC-2 type transport system permease protein